MGNPPEGLPIPLTPQGARLGLRYEGDTSTERRGPLETQTLRHRQGKLDETGKPVTCLSRLESQVTWSQILFILLLGQYYPLRLSTAFKVKLKLIELGLK